MMHTKHIFFLTTLCGLFFAVSCTNPDEEAQECYRQGRELRKTEEPAQAMNLFLQAAQSGTKDETLLGRVYSNMANICRQADEHATAYRIYTLSAEHFAASGDSLAYAYAFNNMAWEQAVMGNKDSALLLISKAALLYPRPPLTDKIKESRAAACLFAEEYDSVLYWTSPPADDYLLTLRAQAYSFLNNNDSATYYARLLLPRTAGLSSLDDLYYILTHNDTQAPKETVLALASQRADVQKALEIRRGKLAQAVQLYLQHEKKRNNPWSKLWLPLLLCVVIAFCIAAGRLRYKRRLLNNEQNRYEQQRLAEIEQTAKTLRETQDLRAELQWNDFQAFCLQTDKFFHGLAGKLQAQGLNETDLRICILVLIGMTHNEIADMIPCSRKSIGKLKDLAARKLSISGGQLRTYLLHLARA